MPDPEKDPVPTRTAWRPALERPSSTAAWAWATAVAIVVNLGLVGWSFSYLATLFPEGLPELPSPPVQEKVEEPEKSGLTIRAKISTSDTSVKVTCTDKDQCIVCADPWEDCAACRCRPFP